jgi:hypothetical protein
LPSRRRSAGRRGCNSHGQLGLGLGARDAGGGGSSSAWQPVLVSSFAAAGVRVRDVGLGATHALAASTAGNV